MKTTSVVCTGCITLAALAAVSAALSGCQSSKPGGSRGVATEAQRAAALDQIKALAGTWDAIGPDGKPVGTSTFSVTSAGSAVREVMFVGHEHEMTNMYHMDGDSLVVTHYCAEGNQPKMRASGKGIRPGFIEFRFDGASNFDPVQGTYMGDLRLVMNGPNELRQEWTSYKHGKVAGQAKFVLRRRP